METLPGLDPGNQTLCHVFNTTLCNPDFPARIIHTMTCIPDTTVLCHTELAADKAYLPPASGLLVHVRQSQGHSRLAIVLNAVPGRSWWASATSSSQFICWTAYGPQALSGSQAPCSEHLAYTFDCCITAVKILFPSGIKITAVIPFVIMILDYHSRTKDVITDVIQ